jgi:hypothetical protein
VVVRVRLFAPAVTLGLLSAAVLGVGAAHAAGDRAGGSQTEPRYRLTQPAVLLFDDFGSYVLLFRLNRDVPRAPNRRALAGVFLEQSMSPALFGGGRRLRCFEGNFPENSETGPPRFGRLYRFRLEVGELPDGPHEPGQLGTIVLRGQARLRHSTPGYSTSRGNAARDPKAAALNCVARAPVKPKPKFAG